MVGSCRASYAASIRLAAGFGCSSAVMAMTSARLGQRRLGSL